MTSRTTQKKAQAEASDLEAAQGRQAGMAVVQAKAKSLGGARPPARPARRAAGVSVSQAAASIALVQPKAGRGRRASSPRTEEARIAELKVKLRDDDYMNGAILRIATVLSARLTLR